VGFNVQLDEVEVGLDVVGFNKGARIGVFFANLKWASVMPKY
jgi:hypothetical protein